MTVDVSQFDHPSWTTAVSTIVGYGLILAVLTVVLFIVPWFVFTML